MDTQLVGDPTDRALDPHRISQCLQRPSSWPAPAAHQGTSSSPMTEIPPFHHCPIKPRTIQPGVALARTRTLAPSLSRHRTRAACTQLVTVRIGGVRCHGYGSGGQPAADGTHSSDGDVESGTIGHPRGAFLASRFSWSKTTLTHDSACTPIRHPPPQSYPLFSAVPVLRPPPPR